MNEPFIRPQQKQPIEFKQVKELFDRVFDPQTFSLASGIQQIKNFGGITSILSLLKISHREGLSSFGNNKKRIEVFGQNVSPKEESIIKKAISSERDFTINLLFYFITLKFFIKLLFIRDGVKVQSLWDEIVSFFLLLIMILLKAKVNLQFLKMDQQKKYYDQKWIKVRRDGQIMETRQKCLMVGDIVILEADSTVRIDGLVLTLLDNDFYVNQSQTILKQESKRKSSILNLKDNLLNETFDPFILSGSTVLYGNAQVLICKIGQQCTFRLKNENYTEFSTQVTPLIHDLKKLLNYVEKFSNIVAFFASAYFAVYYFHQGMVQNNLSWFTFLQILKKFSSLIGFVCLLQKLKIVRSLQFYLESFRSQKNFRIKNKCTLQKLNQVNLFVIQKDAIKIHDTQRGFIIPKINFLSYLNRHFQLKIVSKESKEKLMQQFEICDPSQIAFIDFRKEMFFEDMPNESVELRLKRLKNCIFIPDCPRKKLQSEIIPIFEGLEYRIAYIYKFRPIQDNNKTSKQIISFAFATQAADMSTTNRQGNLEQWVRIKNTQVAQDHIKQIMINSTKFCQLYNVYMVQLVNNIIIFLFLSWISIYRPYSIDFYFSLTIIIIARFIFFKIYRSIVLDQSEPHYEMISHRRIIKLNLFLFFYYLYVLINLQSKPNVVMFFICNAMLRTQILLLKVQKQVSIRNIIKHNFVVFSILSVYLLAKVLNEQDISEQLMLIQYIIGLSVLLVLYGFLH